MTEEAKNNSNQNLIIKLPKDRETYMQKITLAIVASLFVIFIIAKEHYNESLYIFGLLFFTLFVGIGLYVKIYQLITIDTIELSQRELSTKKNGVVVNSCPFEELAIQTIVIKETETTFYKLPSKIKLFSYREKDIGKEESELLKKRLETLALSDANLLRQSTFGQVVPLLGGNMTPEGIKAEVLCNTTKQEMKNWGWIIPPFIVIVVIATMILIK